MDSYKQLMVVTLNKNRGFSSFLALVYIVVGFMAGGVGGGFIAFGFVILPLACIWFSDVMGGFTGISGSVGITASSPGLFVCMAGWILNFTGNITDRQQKSVSIIFGPKHEKISIRENS